MAVWRVWMLVEMMAWLWADRMVVCLVLSWDRLLVEQTVDSMANHLAV